MKLASKEILFKSPDDVSLMYGNSFYVCRKGLRKMRVKTVETKNDLLDSMEFCFSNDNGRTWSEPQFRQVMFKTSRGTRRLFEFPGFIDPDNGKLLTLTLEGTLSNDIALEGLSTYILRYRISGDGEATIEHSGQIIQKGNFDTEHPFDDVWLGNNSMMMGDLGCRPIKTTAGKILIPVQMTLPGKKDKLHIPAGGSWSYFAAVVIIAEWTKFGGLEFELSNKLLLDTEQSTRGAFEPTIIELDNGKILMVVRGSNDTNQHLPSYKWYCFSEDGGYTWSKLQPWTYEDGATFFSPSSCSQLLKHSNGNIYWLGNITPENPDGNEPRYPFIIGKVDVKSGLLIRDSIVKIDDRQPGEFKEMTLSNFMAHEDRQSNEIVLHMSRWKTKKDNYSGDAYIYRISLIG